jgi:hypothetical protein
LEQCDSDQGQAMMSAENALQPVSDKACAWSPKLRNSAIAWQYWRLRLRELDFGENLGHTCTGVLLTTDYWYSVRYFDTLTRSPRFIGKGNELFNL